VRARGVGVLAFLTLCVGCTSDVAPTAPSSTASPSSSSSTSAPSKPASSSSSTPAEDRNVAAARAALARMSPGQKVAQLLLTATSSQAASSALLGVLHDGEVGSVILNGHSFLGLTATRRIVNELQAAVPSSAPALFVSTDQEGGVVQDLNGPGFDTIPSALRQGQLSVSVLRQRAERWGRQLKAAGINLTLGPVLDTVPGPSAAQRNPPIGQLDREFGYTPAVVASRGVAMVKAMTAAGVDATAKHFPGLGRVTGNTDLAAGVTDTQTTTTDPYLTPFAAAIKAGLPFVMMSTAVYAHIDRATPAAFSHRIVTTLLRGTLGFDGVVISDDVGGAAQVASIPVGQRAVRFVAAGGDIVLTVDPAQIPVMRAALLSAMKQPGFARLVDAAALRVVTAKSRAGLL
jgi:beta-N-acetylhexosaminidase